MGMIHAHRTAMSVLRAGLAMFLGGALQVLGGCNAPPPKPELSSEHAGEAASALTADQCLYYDINGKVTICHYTGSESHPYTIVRTSEQGCINGFAEQPNDYIAVGDPNCQGGGCLAVNGPCDETLPCCDGLACSNSVCKDLCAGVTCTASDQCHEAGTCDWHTGLCSNPVKSDGSACNDGNACTQTDACQAGVCVGGNPVTCSARDQCHVAGTCNPADGQCSNPAAPDGTGCTDGDACTQTDACQAGVCVGSNRVICAASDQCHIAGACNPADGQCSNPAAPDGTGCTDGDACTQTDTCQAGACTGSNRVICAASDQCRVAGACNPADGQCSNPPAPDGTGCIDGDACTQTDTCQAGVCAGSNRVTCAASDQCHVAGTCNPADGQCSNPAAPDGTGCIDGDACTQTDTCQAGVCTGTNPLACVNGICAAGANGSTCQCNPYWSGPSCEVRAMVPEEQCITYQRSGTGAWSDTTIASTNLGTAAGTDPTLTVGSVNGSENRILLQVVVAPNEVPPMLQLVSATLQLSISELGNTNPILAYSALAPWDETTTWASFYANPEPQIEAHPVSMANLWQGDTLAFFDVSDYVYKVGRGTSSSKGLLFTQGGDGATTFSSSDVIPDLQPQLQICYIPDLCDGVTCTCDSGPCGCDPMTGSCPGEGG
jgi:hypothetical protein